MRWSGILGLRKISTAVLSKKPKHTFSFVSLIACLLLAVTTGCEGASERIADQDVGGLAGSDGLDGFAGQDVSTPMPDARGGDTAGGADASISDVIDTLADGSNGPDTDPVNADVLPTGDIGATGTDSVSSSDTSDSTILIYLLKYLSLI